MIKVAIKHRTEYQFDQLTQIHPHTIRLRPAPHCRTPITAYSLTIEPKTHFINWQQDPFGNYLARLVFPERARALTVDVELIAEMTAFNPFDFFLEEAVDHYPFVYDQQQQTDLKPYLEIKEDDQHLQAWLVGVKRESMRSVDFLVAINTRLQQDIGYVLRMEPGVQSCEQTLQKKSGSCRDSAWLLVQIFRHLGLAARFVSGYLVQLSSDTPSLDGPSGPAQDFTDLHAWAEVYLPGAGWIGLDPTSGLFAAEGHIPLACTPSPINAAAIDGSTSRCEVTFSYNNAVTRIHEDPRVTKPYTDEQWQRIIQLGDDIDSKMKQQDVRLTMGGEPTFVSIDDRDSPQWNSAALGVHKRQLAGELLLRLKEQFGLGGVLHYGQGKWYPGEQLPRWALSVFFRSDKKTLWHDSRWIADESRDYGYGTTEAKRFLQTLAGQLQIPADNIHAGYEDNLFYLMKEAQLPDNLSPQDNRLKDPLERKRLQQVFAKGLDEIVGFALPLKHNNDKHQWQSSPWQFRRQHLFLIPGDSPMGLRLPLDSLPWQTPRQNEDFPLDPFADHNPLDHFQYLLDDESQQSRREVQPQRAEDNDHGDVVQTALCVEPRGGRLYVFLPPFTRLEAWITLLQQLERCCASLQIPIIIEGYEPPADRRLQKLSVTPDPGVIEVNIHPADNWRDWLHTTEILYEQARQCRLGTEKFMLDGRHTGTGGGNHVTLGAAKAEDSPFLRRPDVLRSMISYWQNHPSLSYLFSGVFIGPTSQSPRVDEARNDHLHELEIAFAQLPEGISQQPWRVDRVLRNFLVDLTGNTHRSEFCIDKLYSPDSSSGRLGILELRSFEMPPHAQMSAVQMLLVRSLLSWFWAKPYKQPLARWGSLLHDRFMLPHFVEEDLQHIVNDLRDDGYAMEMNWFAPFLEFRFPHYGRINVADMELELSAAIEPWHVLGEESSSHGTARYVDSSLERLQVKTRGIDNQRYQVYCNGRRTPLTRTRQSDQFVAGVRYKAWAPWSALHPTIDVHTPLVFDIVDTLNQRSVGGCTYHVSHPGGHNPDDYPVNAIAAEARRNARFWPHGHTQGKLSLAYNQPHPEHPYTLDLRLQ